VCAPAIISEQSVGHSVTKKSRGTGRLSEQIGDDFVVKVSHSL